MLSKQSNFCT